MFGLYFAARVPDSYAEVMACDKERFNRFFHAMLDAGVYLAPSAFEAGFVSAAHTDADIADHDRCGVEGVRNAIADRRTGTIRRRRRSAGVGSRMIRGPSARPLPYGDNAAMQASRRRHISRGRRQKVLLRRGLPSFS